MVVDLRNPPGQGKFSGDAQALAGILQTIQKIQQRNRQQQALGAISSALANNQPLDQVLAGLNEPQQGGFLNRLLNPRAVSGTPSMLEQQLLGSLVSQRIADPQGLGQQQKVANLQLTKARTAAVGQQSPTEQISQKRLKAINELEAKLESGEASATDKAKFESAIGLKVETPQEQLRFWNGVLDVAGRPTLNPDGSLNANPLPNVTAEARRQIKIATEAIRGPQTQTKPQRVNLPPGSEIVDNNLIFADSPVAPVPGARIKVKDKNGNPGTIPASQLQEALKAGFTRVK